MGDAGAGGARGPRAGTTAGLALLGCGLLSQKEPLCPPVPERGEGGETEQSKPRSVAAKGHEGKNAEVSVNRICPGFMGSVFI